MPCLTLPSPLGIALLRTPCSMGAHPRFDRRTDIGASPRPSRFSPKVCAHHHNALYLAPSMPPTPWTDLGRALFVRAYLDGNHRIIEQGHSSCAARSSRTYISDHRDKFRNGSVKMWATDEANVAPTVVLYAPGLCVDLDGVPSRLSQGCVRLS